MIKNLKQSIQIIKRAKTIAIACHINPDGDCIGSLLSLGLALKKSGKKVYMLSIDGVPKRYCLLPGASQVTKMLNKKVDLAISVDCGEKKLLGKSFAVFKKAQKILEIDHHNFRSSFGDITLVDKKAAAVGEIIYMLLRQMKIKITADIAENILVSILVETNSFRLPNVRSHTFFICTQLMKTGIDFHKISDLIYWSKTKEAALISAICITKSKFLSNNKIIWSIVTKKDFKKCNARDVDVDPVANDMLSVDKTQVSVFFRENHNKKLRVSLRSKGRINVAALAEKFGGGGHFDCASCQIPNTKKSIKSVLTYAEKIVENLKLVDRF